MTLDDGTRVLALVILIAALDWAALDDITTGYQPSFWLEWVFLAVSVPLLWLLWRTGRPSSRSGVSGPLPQVRR